MLRHGFVLFSAFVLFDVIWRVKSYQVPVLFFMYFLNPWLLFAVIRRMYPLPNAGRWHSLSTGQPSPSPVTPLHRNLALSLVENKANHYIYNSVHSLVLYIRGIYDLPSPGIALSVRELWLFKKKKSGALTQKLMVQLSLELRRSPLILRIKNKLVLSLKSFPCAMYSTWIPGHRLEKAGIPRYFRHSKIEFCEQRNS